MAAWPTLCSFVFPGCRRLLGPLARQKSCTYTSKKTQVHAILPLLSRSSSLLMARDDLSVVLRAARHPSAFRYLHATLPPPAGSPPHNKNFQPSSLFLHEGLLSEQRRLSFRPRRACSTVAPRRRDWEKRRHLAGVGAVEGGSLMPSPLRLYIHLRRYSTAQSTSGESPASVTAKRSSSSSTPPPPPYGGIPAKHLNPHEVERLVSARAAAETRSNVRCTSIPASLPVYTYISVYIYGYVYASSVAHVAA